jgi:hypothetical protein
LFVDLGSRSTSGCGPLLERRSRWGRCGQSATEQLAAPRRIGRANKHRASLPRTNASLVKKALSRIPVSSLSREKLPFRIAKRPNDGRPLGLLNIGSLRGSPVSHGPYAVRVLQARAGGGGIVFSLCRFGQGRERCLRQEVPEAIGVGAKSPWRAIAMGSVETRCSRPLTLKSFGGCPLLERQLSGEHDSRPNHEFRWFGMFERSSVVLVRTFICRSRTSARGLEGAREQRAARGLVHVFERR